MNEEIGEITPEVPLSSTGPDEATAAAAAFASARGEAPREPVVDLMPKSAEVTEAAEPAKVLAGMTEAQIADLLSEIPKYRKQIDNLAGNNGKLNAALQKLQQETLNGEAVTVTDEDFAEMANEWPELAGMTKNMMSKILGRINLRGTGTAETPEAYVSLAKQAAQEVATQERVKTHIELLDGLHAGWDKIIGLPGADGQVPDTSYRKWLATQPAEYQTKLNESNNAFEIGASITAFNAAQEAATKKQQQNKQRLANAVQPEGQIAARGVISEQSAADKAFNARRQRN